MEINDELFVAISILKYLPHIAVGTLAVCVILIIIIELI